MIRVKKERWLRTGDSYNIWSNKELLIYANKIPSPTNFFEQTLAFGVNMLAVEMNCVTT
jgi:hypothetical protein